MNTVKFLGKYYLQEKVASSQVSNLYRAMEIGPHGFERMVALHRLSDELIRDERRRNALSESVALLQDLTHPNLVRVFELGNVREDWFIVREWVHGTSLRVFLSRMQAKITMTVEESLFLARQLFEALEAIEIFAEEHNLVSLVHGQIHPNNVILGYDGEVKLTGLGLTDLYRSREVGPQDLDSLPYRSPEELNGKPLDARADVFSVGTVLFEALTGKPLWLGKDNNETAARIQVGLPVHQAVERGLSREVAQFVCKAVEPRRDWRFLGAADATESLVALAPRLQPAECRQRLSSRLHQLFDSEIERERVKVLEEHRTLAKLLGSEPPSDDELYQRRPTRVEESPMEDSEFEEGEEEDGILPLAAPRPAAAAARAAQRLRLEPTAAPKPKPSRSQPEPDADLLVHPEELSDGITTGRLLESLVFEEAPPLSAGSGPMPEPETDPYNMSEVGDLVRGDELSTLVRSGMRRPPGMTTLHSERLHRPKPGTSAPQDSGPVSLVYNDELPAPPPPPPASPKRPVRPAALPDEPELPPVPDIEPPIGELVPLGPLPPKPTMQEPSEPERIAPAVRPPFGIARAAVGDRSSKKDILSLQKPQVSRDEWRRSLEQLGTGPVQGFSQRTKQLLWLAVVVVVLGILLVLFRV
jgi:serine/threonine protein kinase